MDFNTWFLVVGAVLTMLALSTSLLNRLPIPTVLPYLVVGVAIGPLGIGLLDVLPIQQASLIERLSEVAVSLSLFAAGLKLRTRLTHPVWWLPVRLAFVSMTLTVGMLTLVGYYGLGLPLGGAVLLGAVLAPTDPVLAADVQIVNPDDRDRLRFSLTGEAGLNDGTAFPFVMLGLGLLGLHDLGDGGWRWFGVDVLWAIVGGVLIGAALGAVVARLVLFLRREHKEALGSDDFLALGLVFLSYGVAIAAGTYAFLATFAAGLALRTVERGSSSMSPPAEVSALAHRTEATAEDGYVIDAEDAPHTPATHPVQAPAYMASAVLGFTEQFENMGLVMLVILVGAMLVYAEWSVDMLWFIPLLFLVIRPVAVYVGLLGAPVKAMQRRLIAWFGIRGIGSIYYLAYATAHGLPTEVTGRILGIVLATISASIVVHGISVGPLMRRYEQQATGRG
jgi:NhaP-type Na+/H+ or K+/H+ antiporter